MSARRLLFALFGSLLLVTLGATTWLLADGGERIVRDVVEQAATASQEATSGEVARFLAAGDAADQQLALAFDAPRVSAEDAPGVMQRLLRDIERVTEAGTVSNLYVGFEDGRFYGLTADPADWPTMFWRYTAVSPATDGRLAFYTDANDNLVGPELERAEPFDPRSRPWYVAASEAAGSIWTEVYPNFGDDTPTITRATALVGRNGTRVGVAGADLFVPHLQRFLATLELSANSEVFVIDAPGAVLAAWGPIAGPPPPSGIVVAPLDELRFLGPALSLLGAPPVDRGGGGTPGGEDGAPSAPVREARWATATGAPPLAGALPATTGSLPSSMSGPVVLDGEVGYLSVATLVSGNTPPWQVGVFVPGADYLESVGEQARRVVPLGLAIVAFALAAYASFASLVSRPLVRLGAAADRIAVGRFDEPVPVPPGREVGALARAIDDMRTRLGTSFEALDSERERATATLRAIEDAVAVTDEDGRVTLLNRAAERLLECREADARGEPVERVLVARDARTGLPVSNAALRGELAATRRDGLDVVLEGREEGERHARLSVTPLGGRLEPRGALLVLHDLTLAARLNAELAWAASHDALTGLLNRRELEARIGRALDETRERGTRHALAVFGLEHFARVNDEIGHAGGDELLRQAARLLERCAGAEDEVEGGSHDDTALLDGCTVSVARIGGDAFAVLVEGGGAERARALFETMRDAVASLRFVWTERGFEVGVSVGTAVVDADTVDAGAALGDARAACAVARESGTNRVLAYGADAGRRREESGQLRLIERGIEEGRFELVAQEIVVLAGAAPPDVELLLRLRGEDGALLGPDRFLPAAERLGAIGRIDRHVVELALAALVERPAAERGIGRCSINLSGRTLGDETFLPWLLDALARHPVDPATLAFEVTETATISHLSSATRLMTTLAGRGVEFALDDFGTGLCSFAYLRTLPIDRLKIDGTFVRGLLGGSRDRALVRSMVELGRSLGIATVAECVEDERTLEALRALGVDRVQGYHLHRPAPFHP